MILRWTPRSLNAISDIYGYIAADNPPAAARLRDRILEIAETLLVTQPLMGRTGRVRGTREIAIRPSYILVYRMSGETLEILTVRHAARRWPKRL